MRGSIEAPPTELFGLADAITVLFPWGSLLKTIVHAERVALERIVALARPGASVDVLLNRSVLEDAALCRTLGLVTDGIRDPVALAAAYASAGIDLTRVARVAPPLPYVTTWGQKLSRSGNRAVLRLEGRTTRSVQTVL